MNPQQPGQNPYDFILAPQKAPAPKAYLPGSNGGGMGMRIAIIGGGVVFLIIIVVIVLSLFSKPNPNTTLLTGLAETQQELNRVATTGGQQSSGQGLKNSSITVQLTLLSHQNQTVTYLTKQHIKLTLKQLGVKKSAVTDATLKTATQNSTYDIVYAQVLQNQLKAYSSELKTAYTTVSGTNARKLLQSEYADAQKLLAQLATNVPSTTTAQ
jgi:hypothetical protein